MRTLAPRPVLLMLTLLLIVGAIAFFELRFNRAGPGDTQAVSESAEQTVEPVAETTAESEAASGEAESERDVGTTQEEQATGGPEDKTLTVTVPKMERIKDAAIPDAEGDDEEALKNYAGLHLKGTGFPWQEEANVYLAGHRLGYPATDSFFAFYDQDSVQVGDEVYVTDADGKEYTYRVFENLVVYPTDLWVMEPVPGKNILTLQTCTLPDYSQRLITRAELVEEV